MPQRWMVKRVSLWLALSLFWSNSFLVNGFNLQINSFSSRQVNNLSLLGWIIVKSMNNCVDIGTPSQPSVVCIIFEKLSLRSFYYNLIIILARLSRDARGTLFSFPKKSHFHSPVCHQTLPFFGPVHSEVDQAQLSTGLKSTGPSTSKGRTGLQGP